MKDRFSDVITDRDRLQTRLLELEVSLRPLGLTHADKVMTTDAQDATGRDSVAMTQLQADNDELRRRARQLSDQLANKSTEANANGQVNPINRVGL